MRCSGSDKTVPELERTSISTNSTRQEGLLRPFKDLIVCASLARGARVPVACRVYHSIVRERHKTMPSCVKIETSD